MDSPVLELLYLYLTTIRFIMQDSRADDTKTLTARKLFKLTYERCATDVQNYRLLFFQDPKFSWQDPA